MAADSGEQKKNRLQRLAGYYLVAVFMLAWGFAIARYHVFPSHIIQPFVWEVEAFLKGVPEDERTLLTKLTVHPQLVENEYGFTGFQLRDKEFDDPGYLMLSRFSEKRGEMVIELMRIADQQVLHSWHPPVKEILERTPEWFPRPDNFLDAYAPCHPLLLDDGSVVFHGGGALVRIDKDSNIVWLIARHFHHSLEQSKSDGKLYVSIVTDRKEIELESGRIVEVDPSDGFAVVTLNGKIEAEYPVVDMLTNNGYEALLWGVGGIRQDPIHLNDAEPISRNAGLAKTGDVALSSRHLSSVWLFRPETGQIIWLKTGPWLNQHDIDLLPNGEWAIYGNQVIRDASGLFPTGKSIEIFRYDASTDEVTSPYQSILADAGVEAISAGRSRILDNGDVFLEATHRLLRVSPQKVRWEYTSPAKDGRIGLLSWCRYYTSDEVNLDWLKPE